VSAAAWIGVALAGGIGALARHWVGRILVVNLTGTVTLGVLAGAGIDGDARLVIGAGLLGAYTTFSTWMALSRRWRDVLVPLALGLLAIWVGRELGTLLGGA
jgi:CrcB protein